MKKLVLLFLCTLSASSYLHASDEAAVGNPDAGQQKSLVCAACHGNDGNSLIEVNPKLAGQHASYLVKQLQNFKQAATSGGQEGRNNAIMSGMAAPLSEQDMLDLAAYFSSQTATPGSTPEDVVAAGQKLYRGGNAERGIAACIACHGPQGNGMGLANFPDISGQHSAYVKAQLEAFRSGVRNNDPNGMMRDIAKRLTDEDIEILSKYVAGLH